MNDIICILLLMELNRMGMFPDENYRDLLNELSIAYLNYNPLKKEKGEVVDLIQHVGYDEAQCGREK